MNKMKISSEQFKLLESGNKTETENGIYYNFPYWIKKNGEEDLYELYAKSEIPGLESNYKKGGLESSKYQIKKTDGSTMDPNAWYFVLRIDKDPHAKIAAISYAMSVKKDNLRLAIELLSAVQSFTPNELKTSDNWSKMYPYKIIDADGWDRNNFNYSWFEELVTWKEFNNRVMASTCIFNEE
jgi:hypothetical protein